MRYLLVYHRRLRDILRLFPACRALAAQGHEVALECDPIYHDIFACVDYVQPVALGQDRGQYDRVLELGVDVYSGGTVAREHEFRATGKSWAEFVYAQPDIAGTYDVPVFTRIQHCAPGDYGLPANGEYGLLAPMGDHLHRGYDPAKLGAWCQQQWPKRPLYVLLDRDDKKFPPFLRARRLRDLPALISWPREFASVNSAAAVIAAAVRGSYVHFPERGLTAADDAAFPKKSQVCTGLGGERSRMDDDIRVLRAKLGPSVRVPREQDTPLRVAFFTTLDHNVGDEFIREGIRAALEAANVSYEPYFICKHKPETVSKVWPGDAGDIGDKYWNADVVVQAGAPVYWHLMDGQSTSLTSEWHDWFWLRRVLGSSDREHPLFLNLGAGSCFNWGDRGERFVRDPGCADFVRRAGARAALTVVREAVAADVLRQLGVKHVALPCPAFLAGARHRHVYRADGRIGVNLMPLGGHFELDAQYSQSSWIELCLQLLGKLRAIGPLWFIAHNEEEEKFLEQLTEPGETVFRSDTWRAYLDAFAQCSLVVANRVHAAVCSAGLGVPAMIVGNDTRAEIGRFIGLPVFRSGHADVGDLFECAENLWRGREAENTRLLQLREQTLARYAGMLSQLDFEHLPTRRARRERKLLDASAEPKAVGAPNRLLFSKTDALGDQVIWSGAVKELLDAHPRHHVLWLVRDAIEGVAELFDEVRVSSPNMHRSPEAEANRLCRELPAAATGWGRVTIVAVPLHPYGARKQAADCVAKWWVEFVHALGADLAIAGSATVNWVDQLLVGASAARVRIGFELQHSWQRLHPDLQGLLPAGGRRPFTHELPFATKNDETGHAEALAAAVVGRPVVLRPALTPRNAELPSELALALKHALVVAPGAGAAGRALPVATAADAIAGFLRTGGSDLRRCVVLEGPGDREIVAQLAAHLSARRIEFRIVALRSDGLALTMALLRVTRLFLCNDTSYAHLAAFAQTPTVAVWGLGHWPRFVPRAGALTIVRTELACKGCEWDCCFEKWNCVQLLPAVAVMQALVQRFAARGDPSVTVQVVPPVVSDDAVRSALARKNRPPLALPAAGAVAAADSGLRLAETDVLFQSGKWAEARLGYQQLLAAEPESSGIMVKLAATCLRMNDARAAEPLLARILKREPNHIEALRVSAEFAVQRRNGHLALQLYARITAAAPTDTEAHFQIGHLHALAGRRAEARQAFATVLELNPAHAAARQRLAALEADRAPKRETHLSNVS